MLPTHQNTLKTQKLLDNFLVEFFRCETKGTTFILGPTCRHLPALKSQKFLNSLVSFKNDHLTAIFIPNLLPINLLEKQTFNSNNLTDFILNLIDLILNLMD